MKKKAAKDSLPKSRKPLVGSGHAYSKQEADDKREALTAALESDFESLDKYLWMRQRRAGIDTKDNQPIWSDIDTDETAALVRLMLRGAQAHELGAVIVDGVIDSADYLSVFTIFGPRIKRTSTIMKETRQARPGRTERSST